MSVIHYLDSKTNLCLCGEKGYCVATIDSWQYVSCKRCLKKKPLSRPKIKEVSHE